MNKIKVLDHGFIKIRNISGPTRRVSATFDADDTDPANSARMSFHQMDSGRTREEDIKLAEYLIKNGHTTPIEMIEVWIEMKMPIFVARQFVRHRTASINEVSARYTMLTEEWYIPKLTDVTTKSSSNKQGRSTTQHLESNWFCAELNRKCAEGYTLYESAIKRGIAPELARLFLHVNHYTHWLWKQDLHNLMHFLSLRQHSHAQWEAQQYANAIHAELSKTLPELMGLYNKYQRKK